MHSLFLKCKWEWSRWFSQMYYSSTTCPYLPCPWAWTPTQGLWISQFWEKSTWTSWTISCIYFFIKYIYGSGEEEFLKFKHISIFTLFCKILHNKDWEAGKMPIWAISFKTFSLYVHIGPFLWPESLIQGPWISQFK